MPQDGLIGLVVGSKFQMGQMTSLPILPLSFLIWVLFISSLGWPWFPLVRVDRQGLLQRAGTGADMQPWFGGLLVPGDISKY
jgi:hypothetical protein